MRDIVSNDGSLSLQELLVSPTVTNSFPKRPPEDDLKKAVTELKSDKMIKDIFIPPLSYEMDYKKVSAVATPLFKDPQYAALDILSVMSAVNGPLVVDAHSSHDQQRRPWSQAWKAKYEESNPALAGAITWVLDGNRMRLTWDNAARHVDLLKQAAKEDSLKAFLEEQSNGLKQIQVEPEKYNNASNEVQRRHVEARDTILISVLKRLGISPQ